MGREVPDKSQQAVSHFLLKDREVVGDQLVTEYKTKSGRIKTQTEFTVVAMRLIQA